MPYHQTGIHKLSPAQVSKLLNGHAIRVKHGSHHKMHLSTEQHKKLHKAHAKGKASTITLDPFQIQTHQHLRGKGTLRDWGMEQYNKIPEEYHPGIESIGRAGLKQAGFGLKKRGRPRKMHGEGFWDDVRGKFQQTFTPDLGRRVARGAIEYGLPAAVGALTTASGNPELAPFTSAAMKYAAPSIERSAGLGLRKRRVGGSLHSMAKSAFRAAAPTVGRVLKPIAKQVAHEVVKYGEAAAGPAAAAAAVAAGQPELAPFALMAGNMMAHQGAKSANKYIEGLGLARNAAGRGRPRKTHHSKMHHKIMSAGALSPAGYSY